MSYAPFIFFRNVVFPVQVVPKTATLLSLFSLRIFFKSSSWNARMENNLAQFLHGFGKFFVGRCFAFQNFAVFFLPVWQSAHILSRYLFRHAPLASQLTHEKLHSPFKDFLAGFHAPVRVRAVEAEIRIFVPLGKVFLFC